MAAEKRFGSSALVVAGILVLTFNKQAVAQLFPHGIDQTPRTIPTAIIVF